MTRARTLAAQQAKHNALQLHRMCAGVTTFRVRDPDPAAVDGGRVFGVRIEVFGGGESVPFRSDYVSRFVCALVLSALEPRTPPTLPSVLPSVGLS